MILSVTQLIIMIDVICYRVSKCVHDVIIILN